MQKFYIQKDYQQQGPFSTEELKNLKITRNTMVWFDGQDNWVKAIEVDHLQELFRNVPPPVKAHSPVIPRPSISTEGKTPGAHTKNKANTTLIIAVVALLFIGGLGALFYNQQAKQSEVQRQLEEQNAKILEQERIESIRLAKEEEQRRAVEAERRQAELGALRFEYDQAITSLRAAKIKLNDVQKFHLLRTASEKQQQIKEQLQNIIIWENEVDRMKKEIDKY